MIQARQVQEALGRAWPDWTIELVPITTTGDRLIDVPVESIEGKGIFLKELEEALLNKTIDCAVHSMKDVPTEMLPELMIGAVLKEKMPVTRSLRDSLSQSFPGVLPSAPEAAEGAVSSFCAGRTLRSGQYGATLIPASGNGGKAGSTGWCWRWRDLNGPGWSTWLRRSYLLKPCCRQQGRGPSALKSGLLIKTCWSASRFLMTMRPMLQLLRSGHFLKQLAAAAACRSASMERCGETSCIWPGALSRKRVVLLQKGMNREG